MQDIVIPIERPRDMVAHLRAMPAEEVARRQAALREARSRLFYMDLPHGHGPTASDILLQHSCRRAGRGAPAASVAAQRRRR